VILAVAIMAGIAIAVLAVLAGILALFERVLRYIDRGAGPDDSDPGEGGGGGGAGPPGDPPGPGGDPAWWPEFERRFAEHVAVAGGRSA
jgi:hypothetical protein